MKLTLDDWQKKVLETKGNLVLRSGRQVGKSTVIAQKAGDFACRNPKKTVLVIASVERQAYLLFEKIMSYVDHTNRKMIRKGRHRPTKSKLSLSNGSTIYCLPTGLSGHGIRGYTIDLLIADEAAFIPEEVWSAVTPMLAVTQGDIILLSTPFGKGGYFFRCFSDPEFTSFHISSEDCPRISKDFLDQEKSRMTKLQYAQEYLGEFVDELQQFFPTDLIDAAMRRPIPEFTEGSKGKNYLGVDVARHGRDDTVLFTLKYRHDALYELAMDVSRKTYLTDTARRIKDANQIYKYRKIYVDDGGLGVGVFDMLLEAPETSRKVVAVNNARRSLDRDRESGQKKRLLKEDLYNNLLTLLEQRKVFLKPNAETRQSLISIQCEYTDQGNLKIFGAQDGRYSHITEALIRAAWCTKDKSLNIYFHSY